MNRSTKAMLLSALIFPGSGQFFLKRVIPGIVLASTALIALSFIISKALERAFLITDKIQRGEVQLDAIAISELLSKQPTASESQLLNIAYAVLVISWLISIADAYREGRIQET